MDLMPSGDGRWMAPPARTSRSLSDVKTKLRMGGLSEDEIPPTAKNER
jgi:hypothetical protein